MVLTTWKYWHSPMIHAMAVVVAYKIYKELAEGNLNPELKVGKPLNFVTFQKTLVLQMLAYIPFPPGIILAST